MRLESATSAPPAADAAPRQRDRDPRLLVVVSDDYGELGNALYFLNGLALSPPPLVLMPRSLAQADAGDGHFEARTYATLDDLRRAVTQFQPDVALIFSAYLLAVGRRLSWVSSLALFRLLRRRGVKIATSDPFLGLLRHPASLHFDDVLRGTRPSGRLAARVLGSLIALRTWLISRAVRGAWHIYPAPLDHGRGGVRHRWLAYYNDHAPTLAGEAEAPAPHAQAKRWLFVLSRVDHDMQIARHGSEFVDSVAGRLLDARRIGARVLLIGPAPLVAALRTKLPPDPLIEVRQELAYPRYMRALMDAEYVFFWNFYSFSIIHRIIAGRPVFFFDEGHMVKILPALKLAGIDMYYGGWRPPLLPADEALDPATLDAQALEARAAFARIVARLRTCEAPREMLRDIAR